MGRHSYEEAYKQETNVRTLHELWGARYKDLSFIVPFMVRN